MSYLAEWKKVKPSSLKKETLSDALKTLDSAIAKFAQGRSRENLAALGGAAKTAVRAHAETVKQLDPKKNAKVVQFMAGFGKKLDFMSDSVTKWQKELAAYMQESAKRRDTVVKALSTSASRPSLALAQTAFKQAHEYVVWINKRADEFTSEEMTVTAQQAVRAEALLKEWIKTVDPKSGMKPDKIKTQQAGLLKEMKTITERLSSPIKMVGVKFQGEGRVLSAKPG